MKRALFFVAVALGFGAILAAPSQAAPVDGILPVDGFAAGNAHDTGITLDPLGDLGIDASAIARVWPGEIDGGTHPPASGDRGFAPPADFEALLRDGNGRGPNASGLDRNPYFALGTWGGDGRAIVHQVIDADRGTHSSPAGADYAVELAFHGFSVIGGRRDDGGAATEPFDGDPMFIPNSGLDLVSNTGAGSPGTDFSTANNGGGSGGGGDPGGNNGGDNSGGGSSGGGSSGGGSNGGGDPGPSAGGNCGNGGAPCPVPEPSGLMLLLAALPLVLLMRRRRAWARVALPAVVAAAALAVAPGTAKAQLHDWEMLCNGTGGATPEVVIEGCSAVIGSDNESLNDVAIAYNNRGNAERELGHFDEAKADYDNAIILAASDPFPYRNRGVTYGLLGDYGRALADFNHAIALAPKYASAYLGRAFAFQALGNPRAAAADFARAAKLDPNLVAQLRAPQTQSAALPPAR